MFSKVDAFILEHIFTPATYWYGRKTGHNQFHLAWFCFGILFVFRCLDAYLSYKNGSSSDLFSVAISAIVIPIYAVLLISAQNADERFSGNATALAPPFLAGFSWLRLVFFMIGIAASLKFATIVILQTIGMDNLSTINLQIDFAIPVWTTALGSGLYFASVKNPPPKPRHEDAKDMELIPIRT